MKKKPATPTPPSEADAATGEPALEVAALGASIRSARMLKGLKLREIAEMAGCSESLLSKIENGRVSPALPTLIRIAQTLQVPVAALFSPIDHRHVVTRAGHRPVLPLHGPRSSVERLVRPDGGHLLEANLHILAPGGGSRGTLSHEGEEVGYVLSGRLELTVGQEVFTLEAGDSFNFRSEIEHAYRNPGNQPARVVWVSTPSRAGARIRPQRKPASPRLATPPSSSSAPRSTKR